ncbi:hypothetical protein BCR42DRAFT_406255 [Absidia repens]|uniref:Uncharacterized protein n=1 Tax=Absidia repens TaxID=90262 RepID=A0A1X2IW82_9FUNG|nr:hypothetical protein BCR42DRAFT_406255 [Absidia repens]
MLDFLSSPVLFPSDMDLPKLSAGATFKLPEPMNWADHDYYNTMVDKSMTSLTDLTKLEPVNENNMHVYAPFILDGTKRNTATHLGKAVTDGFADDHSKRLALLGLAQSMVQAYSLPFYSTPMNPGIIVGDKDDDEKQRGLLRANLRGALDVVEHDMQQNGHDSLYSSRKHQQPISNSFLSNECINGQWSWREEIVDVPDLVHSVCSSPSTHSLAEDRHPSTPVLLESGISYVDNDAPDEQQLHDEIATTLPMPSTISVTPSITSLQQHPQHDQNMKKPRSINKWMTKMKHATSIVKQDCVKSISSTSRKVCQWIKK